ncbi:MAG: hypothetical protein ACT4QD_05400 [Acidobacteriota bacterium]
MRRSVRACRICACTTALLVACAASSEAQMASVRFENLNTVLRERDVVDVEGVGQTSGSRWRLGGEVIGLSPGSLRIRSWDGVRDLAGQQVTRVTHEDSTTNGLVIGLVVGGLAGAVPGGLSYALCQNEIGEGCTAWAASWIAVGAGLGGLFGWAIDKGKRRSFAFNPSVATTPRVSFAPVIAPGTMGVRVQARF